jgi:hypothetical protein
MPRPINYLSKKEFLQLLGILVLYVALVLWGVYYTVVP